MKGMVVRNLQAENQGFPVYRRIKAKLVSASVIRMPKKIRDRYLYRLPAATSMRFRIRSAATYRMIATMV